MHPETGRQSLFMGGHVYGISDMTPEDPGQSLNGLVDEACHGERAIEHTWTPWGVMVRYNSRLLHRVMPCDERHETIISLNCRNTVDPDKKGIANNLAERSVEMEHLELLPLRAR